MSSLQKEPKIYGAVESQSYITFTGFCKKIYDTTQQSVDVFIDDVKIDTILANQKIRDIENKYEVFDTNGFCFTYELSKEYIGKKHKIEFKTKDGEQLLHSPTHTLDKFSPLYNQAMFIESLAQPLQYHAVENGYTKNALSFIAIEENLGDEAFIEFVLEMCKKHKELSLSIFYFNEHQKNEANKVLNQVKNKTFFNPTCAEELIKNSEIYLHNVVDEFRFTLNEEYYNKIKNVQALKENLFMIELTRKAKKKKEMAKMVVNTVTPILFQTSVMAEMFKDDDRYNEFVFMNSLGQVDEAEIKDMYCPNSIGFLATEENLEDEDFMEYIKKLMERFPDVEFKGFCFNNKQKNLYETIFQEKQNFNYHIIGDICGLLTQIEIMIFNWEKLFNSEISYCIYQTLINHSPNIFTNCYWQAAYKISLKEADRYFDNSPFFNDYKYFGFELSDFLNCNNSYHKVLYNKVLALSKINFSLDLNISRGYFKDFLDLEFALSSTIFKNFMFNFNKKSRDSCYEIK